MTDAIRMTAHAIGAAVDFNEIDREDVFVDALSYDRVIHALEESLNLQSHYAYLLNAHDGGERIGFATADKWIARLAATAKAELAEATCKHGVHPYSCLQGCDPHTHAHPANLISMPKLSIDEMRVRVSRNCVRLEVFSSSQEQLLNREEATRLRDWLTLALNEKQQ